MIATRFSSSSNLHLTHIRLQLAVVPCVYQRGNQHQILLGHRAVDWLGGTRARSAIALGWYQACAVPFALSGEAPNSIPSRATWLLPALRSSRQATSHFLSANRHRRDCARGSVLTMVQMDVVEL